MALKTQHTLSKHFLTNMQKLHKGIWPWTYGLKSRLPMHYKIKYTESWMKQPQPVHYHPETRKYVADEFGEPVRTQNIPIPVLFPHEADEGLWGGEGIVAGLRTRKNLPRKPRAPTIWKPYLSRKTFYSEILDKYFDITVTNRTLDLIDENYGFDYYILQTHQVDLRSKLGMILKRQMLITLAKKSFYENDAKKREEIYNKYKKFEIPLEEAEWVGLSLYEAERKQNEIEEQQRLLNLKPLKYLLADELIVSLDNLIAKGKESDSSWISSFNPFTKNSEK